MNQSLIQEMHYFRMPVTDLEESVNWYTEHLGFHLKHRTENLAVVELQSGPLLIIVKADQSSRGHFTVNGQSEFSVAFTTTDIQQLYSSFKEQGIQVDEIKEDNGHLYFHFFDPSGNKLQVHN